MTRTYGEGALAVHALRDVSLTIEPGQLVVILGPSGSGKTTLMNLIGGIEPVTSGSIVSCGRDLTKLDDEGLTDYRRDRVGFIYQFFNLIPNLTALENVALVAELVGRDMRAAADALAAVGLADRAEHFPGALSGGEQQRVAIARAIVKRPPLLLADEPTGSLDLDTGRLVLQTIQDLSRETDLTVLLVTHNSAIAGIADRIIRMRSGSVVDDRANDQPTRATDVVW